MSPVYTGGAYPSTFDLAKRLRTLPNGKVCLIEEGDTPEALSKTAKYLRALQAHFWRKWQSEYFSELKQHHTARISKARKGMVNAEI